MSSTTALPVSVERKSRTGAARLRAHAVLPLLGLAWASAIARAIIARGQSWRRDARREPPTKRLDPRTDGADPRPPRALRRPCLHNAHYRALIESAVRVLQLLAHAALARREPWPPAISSRVLSPALIACSLAQGPGHSGPSPTQRETRLYSPAKFSHATRPREPAAAALSPTVRWLRYPVLIGDRGCLAPTS